MKTMTMMSTTKRKMRVIKRKRKNWKETTKSLMKVMKKVKTMLMMMTMKMRMLAKMKVQEFKTQCLVNVPLER